MEKANKIINYITVIGFFLILSFPMINGYMQFVLDEEMVEKRILNVKPVFDPESLDNYTEEYDKYYSDNFSLRTNMINFLNINEFKVFGISPKPGLVTVGKEGWFFATKSIGFYSNQGLLSEKNVKDIKNELIQRNNWCEKKGIKYYTVIVPNKMNIYPEYLPRTVIKKQKKSRYDQLMEMNSDPNINIIGLKENILKHKNDGRLLYQKTDDHWTNYGAFFGYQEILKTLNKDFPELVPQSLSDYQISIEDKIGNMAELISLGKMYPEHNVKLTIIKNSKVKPGVKTGYKTDGGVSQNELEITWVNPDGAPLKCLIIRDSFTFALMNFMNEHFQSTIYIHDEWRARLRQDIIEIEKPDIVIVIALETHFDGVLTNPSF